VTRMEPYTTTSSLIGIQFYRLQSSVKIALLQGLAKNLKQQMQEKQDQYSKRSYLWAQIKKYPMRAILLLFLIAAWSYLQFFRL